MNVLFLRNVKCANVNYPNKSFVVLSVDQKYFYILFCSYWRLQELSLLSLIFLLYFSFIIFNQIFSITQHSWKISMIQENFRQFLPPYNQHSQKISMIQENFRQFLPPYNQHSQKISMIQENFRQFLPPYNQHSKKISMLGKFLLVFTAL